jgi:hypothetical protein
MNQRNKSPLERRAEKKRPTFFGSFIFNEQIRLHFCVAFVPKNARRLLGTGAVMSRSDAERGVRLVVVVVVQEGCVLQEEDPVPCALSDSIKRGGNYRFRLEDRIVPGLWGVHRGVAVQFHPSNFQVFRRRANTIRIGFH